MNFFVNKSEYTKDFSEPSILGFWFLFTTLLHETTRVQELKAQQISLPLSLTGMT